MVTEKHLTVKPCISIVWGTYGRSSLLCLNSRREVHIMGCTVGHVGLGSQKGKGMPKTRRRSDALSSIPWSVLFVNVVTLHIFSGYIPSLCAKLLSPAPLLEMITGSFFVPAVVRILCAQLYSPWGCLGQWSSTFFAPKSQ